MKHEDLTDAQKAFINWFIEWQRTKVHCYDYWEKFLIALRYNPGSIMESVADLIRGDLLDDASIRIGMDIPVNTALPLCENIVERLKKVFL